MRFLMEHEVGFADNELGFPSIQGCHAIVYQTAAGLYGYHNAGGSASDRWKPRAVRFAEFVRTHAGGTIPKGTRLYGISFVGNNQRGYSPKPKDNWKGELITFAAELNYTNKISGYDLDKGLPGGGKGAYVEYRKNGSKCDVHIREWDPRGVDAGEDRTANIHRNDHKFISVHFHIADLTDLDRVIRDIHHAPLTKISKEKLR